jgi:hypothetical protein
MADLDQHLHEALGLDHWSPAPNYVADPRLVLKEMQKRDDYEMFLTYVIR